MAKPVLHVVHCIDTEGPLNEDLPATFERLNSIFGVDIPPSQKALEAIQNQQMDLGGCEKEAAKVFSKELLSYNRNWADVQNMLDKALSSDFRNEMLDDEGNGWVYSWHCMDHLGLAENPRHKDLGYGNVFHFYQQALAETDSKQDEINWHFHPLSLTRHPLSAATSYYNAMDILLPTIARRIIDDAWFPTTNRPGFHAERPDSHAFLEQWMPFDYASQALAEDDSGSQKDASYGRFGNWVRAPKLWGGYRPHHDDYQSEGHCRRWIFRCLNVGTRFRLMTVDHVAEAFTQAQENGSAVLAFADHDYRDICPDVNYVRDLLKQVKARFPDVVVRFSGAEQAAKEYLLHQNANANEQAPVLSSRMEENRFHVTLEAGALFGPQPFLAIKDKSGRYYHDNFDEVQHGKEWCYVLDSQTLPLSAIESIAAASAGPLGGFHNTKLTFAS